jgi:hypothetical protein
MERVLDHARIADNRTAPHSSGRSLDRLTALQTLLAVASAVQVCRGAGRPVQWVLLATALPLLRLIFDAGHRRSTRAQVRRLWASVETFAVDPTRLPWRATGLLVVLPAGLFFLSQTRPVTTGDSKPILLTACGLVCEGTSDLHTYAALYGNLNHYNAPGELPYFLQRTATGIHSSYPSGMVVFALPPVVLARLLGADLHRVVTHDRLEKAIASGLAAVCLGLFFLLALHLADARSAGLATLLLAVGSSLCSTVAQALWQHGGVLFWMLLALLVEFRTWRRPRAGSVLLQGAALAMMFACRLSSALLILPFGLWLLCRTPRRAILVALLGALAYAPWACYYHALYGTVLGPSVAQTPGLAWRWRETLLPLLLSPDHGLLVYQPWIVLGLAMGLPSVRRLAPAREPGEPPAGWRWVCVASILLHLTLIASWNCWWGGDCWGSRLATETVPFFALLCLPSLAALRGLAWGRRLLLATALAAAFVHLTGVYLKVDYHDTQAGLFSHRIERPGSWQNLLFLRPFAVAGNRE